MPSNYERRALDHLRLADEAIEEYKLHCKDDATNRLSSAGIRVAYALVNAILDVANAIRERNDKS